MNIYFSATSKQTYIKHYVITYFVYTSTFVWKLLLKYCIVHVSSTIQIRKGENPKIINVIESVERFWWGVRIDLSFKFIIPRHWHIRRVHIANSGMRQWFVEINKRNIEPYGWDVDKLQGGDVFVCSLVWWLKFSKLNSLRAYWTYWKFV